jgi:NADP-dependent 3-hydroxy acid dehydrogenase YdfG
MQDQAAKANYEALLEKINLLSPRELADMIFYAYKLPQHICLRQITIAPTNQEL